MQCLSMGPPSKLKYFQNGARRSSACALAISELAVPATRVLVGNVIGHGIQMSEKTRTTARKQWQQLHVLTFLGGRESVCKIICAIGDCLDTSGRLEDLPGWLLILVFGELTDNDILKKVRSLDTVSCATTVEACACLKTVVNSQGPMSQFCTSEMLTLCQLTDTNVAIKLPGQCATMRR